MGRKRNRRAVRIPLYPQSFSFSPQLPGHCSQTRVGGVVVVSMFFTKVLVNPSSAVVALNKQTDLT